MADKIWAHSGDSHFLEPDDLWHQILPEAQADRMPRTERIADDEERVTRRRQELHPQRCRRS